MKQSFTPSADSLYSFFSQPGRGFYIPHYQRNYSWDQENAKKLVDDIFSGIERTLTKPQNSIFLGTVILHDEKSIVVGTHTDTPNLLTRIANVVDGQQRIASIAMLACVLSSRIGYTVGKLKSFTTAPKALSDLAVELADEVIALREFYAVEIKKAGATPAFKPLAIRAGDTTLHPVSDQWTLSGVTTSFYRSNTASFLAQFIDGVPIGSIKSDGRIAGVIKEFEDKIDAKIADSNLARAKELVAANTITDGSLQGFLGYPPDLNPVTALPLVEQSLYCGGLLLKAASSFLKNACHLVVIDCADESLAFDMFQALNATGTPLTAFEVFKPMVVNDWRTSYVGPVKSEVDRVEQVFETETTASGKEDLTDRVIVSTAMAYCGEAISKKFSDERDWLFREYPLSNSALFIGCLADQAEYCLHFILPRRPNRNSTTFRLVTQLSSRGMNAPDADWTALCVHYLKDAGHQFAHSVLSVFYAKLLQAQGNPSAVTQAAVDLTAVAQAAASFFTLWMGASTGRFPDSVYRELFKSASGHIAIVGGKGNQTPAFVKQVFRAALEAQGIYDATNAANAKKVWVGHAKNSAWYSRKAVCRFALFLAAQDAAPDLAPGAEGLYVNGKKGSANMLKCQAWHATEFEVIEHIATRDEPANKKFPAHFDKAIYPGNYSVVDKIGNLTLLSGSVNSSIYSEWPDKVYYYWSLTTPTATTAGPGAAALMTALGISSVPPSLPVLSAATSHVPDLAPLAYRGQQGKTWNAAFIDQRSEHLCARVFDVADAWLR